MRERKQIRQRDARTGRVYVYETDLVYDKTTKKTKLVGRKLVGHIDETTGQVVPNRPKARGGQSAARRLFHGATDLLDQITTAMGLDQDLKAVLPGSWRQFLSLAFYQICQDHSPMSGFARWAASHTHPHGQPVTSQRVSDLLAQITHQHKDQLCALQAARRAETEWWVYDSTSISTWSEQLTQARWGYNKDHQPLTQINLALLFGETTGLPFYYRTLAGNIPDVSTVTHLITTLPFMNGTKPHLACDRGFYSKTNIDQLIGAHIKFLIGVPAHLKLVRQAITDHDQELRSWNNWDPGHDVFALKVPTGWDFECHHPRTGLTEKATKRTYLHLFHSPTLAAADEKSFAALLGDLHSELQAGNRIERHNNLYDRYFTTTSGQPAGKDDAIQAARDSFGHFTLLTNDAGLTPAQALDIYRRKDSVEKAFHQVKNNLDLRTPRVHNDHTLDGKIFLTYIALTITSWLHKAMTQADMHKQWTMAELLDELDTIELLNRPGHQPRILETTKKQRTIYHKLGLTPPTNAS